MSDHTEIDRVAREHLAKGSCSVCKRDKLYDHSSFAYISEVLMVNGRMVCFDCHEEFEKKYPDTEDLTKPKSERRLDRLRKEAKRIVSQRRNSL